MFSVPAFTVRRPGLAALMALGLAVAACSGGGATPSPSAATAPSNPPSSAASPSAEASESAAPSESAESEGEAYELTVATDATVGKYLTGEDGKTLYIFKNDTAPNASTCTGGCATAWPPFTVDEGEDVKAGDGVSGKIATFDRPDGSKQVSYNGQPLYYYAKDTAAGQLNGQGFGGKWFAATP